MFRSKVSYLVILPIFLSIIACSGSFKEEQLYGKWKYSKVVFTNRSPKDSLTTDEIKFQNADIEFNTDGKAKITSSGKIISSGTYFLDGKIIRYKERLQSGEREIPFLIKMLNDNQIIFETMEQDVKQIVANK